MNNSPLGLSNPQFWGDALSTIGTSLLGLGAGRNDWGLLGMQALQQRQQDRLANTRQAEADQRAMQEFEWRKKEHADQEAAKQRAQDAWARFAGGAPQPMTGGLNPAQHGSPPTMPTSAGFLSRFTPEQQGFLQSLAQADPNAAMGIVGEQAFKVPDPIEWDIKTIREGNKDVTYRINPITGDREKLGEGAAWAPQKPDQPNLVTLIGPDNKPVTLYENDPRISQMIGQGGYVQRSGADPNSRPVTEAELKGASLLEKALPELATAEANFDALTNPVDQAAGAVPIFGNSVQSEGYQRARNSIKTIAAAYLYSVSGAQAPETEVQRTVDEVVPKFGDKANTISDKKARLKNMLDSIVTKAGRAASQTQAGSQPNDNDPLGIRN